VRRFIEISGAFAASPTCTTARVKQWLRIANHDGGMPWFEAIKRRESPEEVVDYLGALAAAQASVAVGV
jgi:hypothetical protein